MNNDGRRSGDAVNHPAHYNQSPSGVECIEIVRHLNFNVGNAIKYLWRTDHKDGIQDLEKAKFYIEDEINRRRVQEKMVEQAHFAAASGAVVLGNGVPEPITSADPTGATYTVAPRRKKQVRKKATRSRR